MRHENPKYDDRIIDTAGLIPEDEPVFLVRGQDINAGWIVEHYANHAMITTAHKRRLLAHAERMADWPAKKVPDDDSAQPPATHEQETTETYRKRLVSAMRATAAGEAHHWPTIAQILAAEIERLAALAAAPTAQSEDDQATIEQVANTLRGMAVDPAISDQARELMGSMSVLLDAITDRGEE